MDLSSKSGLLVSLCMWEYTADSDTGLNMWQICTCLASWVKICWNGIFGLHVCFASLWTCPSILTQQLQYNKALNGWQTSQVHQVRLDSAGAVGFGNDAWFCMFLQGNHTSFTPMLPRKSQAPNYLQDIFQLCPGKYKEMMKCLLKEQSRIGERPASVSVQAWSPSFVQYTLFLTPNIPCSAYILMYVVCPMFQALYGGDRPQHICFCGLLSPEQLRREIVTSNFLLAFGHSQHWAFITHETHNTFKHAIISEILKYPLQV